MKQQEIKYKDIIELGFTIDESNDESFWEDYGYPYKIFCKEFPKNFYIEWDQVTRKCELVKSNKSGDIKSRLAVMDLDQLKDWINFFEDEMAIYGNVSDLPDLLTTNEHRLKYGSWYKTEGGGIALFKGFDVTTYGFDGGKFQPIVKWFRKSLIDYNFGKHPIEVEAEEVKDRFINEAKRRGFRIGTYFETLIDDKNKNLDFRRFYRVSIEFIFENGKLYNTGSAYGKQCIFKDGDWARII